VSEDVAKQMTDLLQTAVNTGTGKAAKIGRPVAGKTGTTTSNKDGWFVGFSSGLTTGVWMGRDDAKVVRGLQGGTAPARAFGSYMKRAVAGRPVENFDTQVTMPELQGENEVDLYGEPDNSVFVDEDGAAIDPYARDPALGDEPDPKMDQDWIDRMTRDPAPGDRQPQAPPQQPREIPRPPNAQPSPQRQDQPRDLADPARRPGNQD